MKGQHAIIESYGRLSNLNSSDLIDLLSQAASAAGATIVGSNIHEFGPECGNTAVLLLAESHITVHQWPENRYAAFDIFMCGDSAVEKAIDVIVSADSEGHHQCQVISRGHKTVPHTPPENIANFFIKEQPLIIERINSQLGMGSSLAKTGVIEVIKFMSLSANSAKTLTPSKLIDDIWHELILFTRTYNDTCLKYFGKLIQHQPTNNKTKETNQLRNTMLQYMDTFGNPDSFFWGEESLSQCGPCESS